MFYTDTMIVIMRFLIFILLGKLCLWEMLLFNSAREGRRLDQLRAAALACPSNPTRDSVLL